MIALILGALLALMTCAAVYLLLAGRAAVGDMYSRWHGAWIEQGDALVACRRHIAALQAARELDAAAMDAMEAQRRPIEAVRVTPLVKPKGLKKANRT